MAAEVNPQEVNPQEIKPLEISDDIVAKVIAARSGKTKPTYVELATILLNDSSKAGELRKAVEQRQKIARLVIPELTPLPDPYDLHINGFMHITGSYLLIADLHAPFQNTKFLRQAINIARKYEVKKVVIVGDLFDSNELSSYRKQQEVFVPVMVDLQYGLSIVNYLTKFFEVYFIPGNHDWWLFNHFGTSVNEFWKLSKLPVVSTEYPYAFLNDDSIAGHLDTYDFRPGWLAGQIAIARRRHTFVGHDHISGFVQNDFHGTSYYGVSIGAMLMSDRIYYKHTSFNAYPEWQNGFVIFDGSYKLYQEINGEAALYHEFK